MANGKKVRISVHAANVAANAMAAELSGGWLDVYEGKQPASCSDDVPESSKLLSSVRLGTPAFKQAVNGECEAFQTRPDLDVASTGRPQWFRLSKADHVTALYDGDVSPKAGEAAMHLRALVLGQHSEFHADAVVLVMPRSAEEQ